MKRVALVLLFAGVVVLPAMAEGGTLYLYRSDGLPIQDFFLIANRQDVGVLARDSVVLIRSESEEVLLYVDMSLARGIVQSYGVYRVFVTPDADTYLEISSRSFTDVTSEEARRAIRAMTPAVEATIR